MRSDSKHSFFKTPEQRNDSSKNKPSFAFISLSAIKRAVRFCCDFLTEETGRLIGFLFVFAIVFGASYNYFENKAQKAAAALETKNYVDAEAYAAKTMTPESFSKFIKWSEFSAKAIDPEIEYAEQTYYEAGKQLKPNQNQCCSAAVVNKAEEKDGSAEADMINEIAGAVGFATDSRKGIRPSPSELANAQAFAKLRKDFSYGKLFKNDSIQSRIDDWLAIPDNYAAYMLDHGFVKNMRDMEKKAIEQAFALSGASK